MEEEIDQNERSRYLWSTIILGFTQIVSLVVIFLLLLFITNRSSNQTLVASELTPTSYQEIVEPSLTANAEISRLAKVTAVVEPYRVDIKKDMVVTTFQIEAESVEGKIESIIYWADTKGSCSAQTVPFSEFIEVSEIEDFAFFEFVDSVGNHSEIYAMSPNPVYQCNKLTE